MSFRRNVTHEWCDSQTSCFKLSASVYPSTKWGGGSEVIAKVTPQLQQDLAVVRTPRKSSRALQLCAWYAHCTQRAAVERYLPLPTGVFLREKARHRLSIT